MRAYTNRVGRALLWLAILLAVGNGVLGVIADRWLAVAIAAAVATLATLALVKEQTSPER